MEKEAFSVLWNGQASAHYAGVRRQRAPYNVQALDYSVSTEKPLIHHLTSAMDDGRLESDPGYNGRLGHVCFWFQSPCTLHVLLHNSLSFGGARLASYIMGRCLTIPKSRVTDSAVESNAQAMPNIKKKRKIFKEHALCDFVKVNKDPLQLLSISTL